MSARAPSSNVSDVMPGSRYSAGWPGVARPLGAGYRSEVLVLVLVLVPVTVWVRPEGLSAASPSRPETRPARGWRAPHVLAGVVAGVAVVATLALCLVIALLALVAWVSAHAVAVGVVVAAVALTGLAFVRALAPTRVTGTCEGWRCECE